MYSDESSSGALMARSAMIGLLLLAAVCLASAAHPQNYSSEDLARRMIEQSAQAYGAPYNRAREFQRMFRLYEPPPAGTAWRFDEIPAEGRAVKE